VATSYTVDASVFLNAFNPAEVGHAASRRCLTWLRDEAVPIVVPSLLLPELAATVARGRDDTRLAQQFAARVRRLPQLLIVPLDTPLAQQAVDIAAQHRLRGSDAVYGAVALRFGSTLLTLDREQRDRLASVLPTCTPEDVLRLLPP
jgi:predicted nucleic acid-binding protein